MNRKENEESLRTLFDTSAKRTLFALRTTFIVGFPGETEEQFEKVLDFAEDMEIDRVGAFAYCAEEGTIAATLPGQLSSKIKEERYNRLMELQSEISLRRQSLFVGRELTVLVETIDNEDNIAWGRSYRDAPEVDGLVGIMEGAHLKEGLLLKLKSQKPKSMTSWRGGCFMKRNLSIAGKISTLAGLGFYIHARHPWFRSGLCPLFTLGSALVGNNSCYAAGDMGSGSLRKKLVKRS